MGEAITGFSTAGDASGDAKVTGRQEATDQWQSSLPESAVATALRALVLATPNVLAAVFIFHAKEIADNLLGEDPNDIDKIYTKLLWARGLGGA